MKLTFPKRGLLALSIALAFMTSAMAQTEISVQYPMPQLLKEAMTVIADDFMKANPGVKVRFLIPADSYNDLLQKSLRATLTNSLPDVSFQALGYLRTYVDRGVAANLDTLIAADSSFKARGDDAAMLAIGKLHGKQYALPFAISAPLIYYNVDAVKKAGGDPANFPTTWKGTIELASKVAALPDMDSGIHLPMASAPDWFWQMMVNSFGSQMIDEGSMKVAFGGVEGQRALQTIADMRDAGKMSPNAAAGQQSFFAGRGGMMVSSNAALGQVDRTVGGRFKWGIAPLPLENSNARIPAGGNLAIIHATDPIKQKAAFEFIKFATGPIGSTYQVKMVGYMSPNAKAVSDPALLGKFYQEHPVYAQSSKQASRLVGWYSYPGENGLKINDLIKSSMAAVIEGRTGPKEALTDLSANVQAQLPK